MFLIKEVIFKKLTQFLKRNLFRKSLKLNSLKNQQIYYSAENLTQNIFFSFLLTKISKRDFRKGSFI